MPSFRVIQDPNEITHSKEWALSTKFNSEGRLVDYQGRQYKIIQKRERIFSGLERVGRGLLGTIAVVCTLCLALFSKSIRNLFTKCKENIRFAVVLQRTLPALEENTKEIKASIQDFKDRALDAFHRAERKEAPLDFALTSEQQNCLLEANKNKYLNCQLQGVKIIKGGCNFVIFLDAIPRFVFKPMKNRELAEKYVEIVKKAREVVAKNRLHLIHVPESKLVEVDGEYFVMQEKADLVSKSYNGVKGIYLYCWNNREMQDYIKEVFSQLLEFISQTGFGDVKYDNLPLAKDGRVALIDLDEGSVMTGLTEGRARKKHGLFRYISDGFFDEFLALAKAKLEENTYRSLVQIIQPIKTKVQNQAEKRKDYAQFCQKHTISCSSQLISEDLPKLFEEKEKQALALSIIKNLNENLLRSRNFYVLSGRTIRLAMNVLDPLIESAMQVFGPLPLSILQSKISEVLEELRKVGYIYKYKVVPDYPFAKVVC